MSVIIKNTLFKIATKNSDNEELNELISYAEKNNLEIITTEKDFSTKNFFRPQIVRKMFFNQKEFFN